MGRLTVTSHPFLSPLWGVLPSSKVKSVAKEAVGGRETLSLGAGGHFLGEGPFLAQQILSTPPAAECGGDLASWVVPRHLSKGQLE